jgi:hypothetical protein
MSTESDNKFALALGRLMLAFADAESATFAVLRHYAGVSPKVARAIFSGSVRIRTMIDFIENIAHNTNMDAARRTDLQSVFSQLATINTARDRLIHHGGEIDIEFFQAGSERKTITNKDRVGRAGKEFVQTFAVSDLESMAHDLRLACRRLMPHWNKDGPFKLAPESDPPSAWRYKPEPPNRKKDSSPQAPESPKRQPKSSRA